MAKARIIDDDTDPEAEELAQLNEDEGGEIFRAIEEMRGTQGTSVIVVKLTPAEEKGYCDSIPVAEFSHDTLKTRYGAGSYKVRIRGPKGWIPGGGTVNISNAGIKKPASGAGGDFMSFLEFTKQQDAERREKSSKLIELGIPALGTILAAFIGRSNGPDMGTLITALKPAPGPTLAEIAQTMQTFAALSTPKVSSDPLDSVLKVMAAVKDLSEEKSAGKGETNWLDVVRDVIREAGPAVGPVIQGAIQARQAQMAAISAGTRPDVTVAPPAAIPASGPVSMESAVASSVAPDSVGNAASESKDKTVDNLKMYMPLIKFHLGKVAKWATEDKDPALYAEVFLAELPSNITEYIPPPQAREYVAHPDWYKFVCEIEPALAKFEGWCNEFHVELIELMKEPETPTEQTT